MPFSASMGLSISQNLYVWFCSTKIQNHQSWSYCIVMVSVLTSGDMCWLLSPPPGVVYAVTASANQRTWLGSLHQSEDSMQLSPGPKGPE